MKKANQILFLSAFLLTFIVTKQINVMQDTEEIWKDIPGVKGYMVSNHGRVKSLDRKVPNHSGFYKNMKSKIRVLFVGKRGYQTIRLTPDPKNYTVHKLVALAFIPNPNKLLFINHKNGIKTCNYVWNLEWCTCQHNIQHAYDMGLREPMRGSAHPNAKLDELQVKSIKLCLKDGIELMYIADYFKVAKHVIREIKSGKTWRHL